ncbi:MAG TPA: phospholipase D-like domain-containing protein [Flavisolibacter sp.]|nr:phospholipase D-like domain-containing protein [Flavisolibacter sp.]
MSKKELPNNAYTLHNKVDLIRGGSYYFNKLRNLIQQATSSVHIHIYVWDDDKTGTAVGEALIEAANRNVSVYVIADGYASQCLSKEFIRNMKAHGVQFRYFEPLLRCSHFYFGRRMHEKLVVIDGSKALVGGINFADRYNDVDGAPPWLDYALYVEGEAAAELYSYCASYWGQENLPAAETMHATDTFLYSVDVVYNDWVKGKQQIWNTYFHFFNQARESITIMCSYFLPGRVLRNRLIMAAKRGVRVKLILAGPSDVMLAKYAERYLYPWMLKNGIEIYEYQPAVLHAKMMVVDGRWVTIGSFNVNNVSAYASIELNLNIRNRRFASSVQSRMNAIIEKNCIEVTERNFISNAGFLKRFLQKSAYELVRVILNLSTFYFKHE